MTPALGPGALLVGLAMIGLAGWLVRRGALPTWLRYLSGGMSLSSGVLALALAGFAFWATYRSQPAPMHEAWFAGVRYERIVLARPRPVVAHLVRVDLAEDGIELVVTPSEPTRLGEVRSRTTRSFATEHRVQLAVNASYFYPFRNHHPFDYEPHVGDPVHVLGFTAACGMPYGRPLEGQATVHMSRAPRLTFEEPAGGVWNALSGMGYVLRDGAPARFRIDEFTRVPYPRSLLGADATGRFLTLLIVEGKQPGYSEGVTLAEAAELLRARGTWNAIQLDGGGSASLVRERASRRIELVSTPVNFKIPGWERSVATHLGVRARVLPRLSE